MIMAAKYIPLVGKYWDKVSSPAKCLVENLLKVDPGMRPTPAEVLECSWLAKDVEVVAKARRVMGLEEEERVDSGRGGSEGTSEEDGRGCKRKLDVTDGEIGVRKRGAMEVNV